MNFFASADRESQEPPLGAMLPRDCAAVGKKLPILLQELSDAEQRQLDEGIDYFSAQGALAAYRLGKT